MEETSQTLGVPRVWITKERNEMKYFYDKITEEMKKKMKSGEVRNVLFVGEQGLGKTYAARKLQEELDIPIKVIEGEDRYLGRAIIPDKPERELYSKCYLKGVKIYITNYKRIQIQENLDKFDLIIDGAK